MMDEGQRLAYLQALGITQYVPLQPVAGMPELPLAAWEEVAAHEPATVVPTLIEEAGTDAVGGAAPPQVDVADAQPETEKAAPAADSSEIPQLDLSRLTAGLGGAKPDKPKASQPLRRFTLALVSLPPRLRLLVQLGSPDAPGFSAREHRMLSDLLLALGSGTDITDANTRLFRWPLVNNPRIAGDPGAARDGLFAFLAAVQSEQPVAKTLILGTAPAGLFHDAEPGRAFTLADLGDQPCLLTHGFAAMEQDWTLKAAAWRHIQSFV